MMNIENLTYKDATHNLSCVHNYNHKSSYEYSMPCIILKKMPNRRVKVLVFGYRMYKLEKHGHKKRIRYVSEYHVKKKEAGEKK